MSQARSGDLIEEQLRTALVEFRPADGAPATLRARVDAMPLRLGDPGIAGRMRRLVSTPTWVTGLMAVIAIALVAVAARHVVPLPQAGGGAPAPAFDPTVEGPGLVTTVVPTLLLAEGIVGLVFGLLSLRALSSSRRSRRPWFTLTKAVVMASSAAVFIWLASVQGVGVGGFNAWGPVLGFATEAPPPADGTSSDRQATVYLTAAPGKPFVYFFVVHNIGPIPVDLDGIVERPDAASVLAPRWTALALGTDPNAFGQPVEQLVPFHPVALAPGDYVTLYVVGKVSACATGLPPDRAGLSYAIRGPDIDLTYSVLGLTGSSHYLMPTQIAEPLVFGCTG